MRIVFIFIVAVVFGGCNSINPSIMFRTAPGFDYQNETPANYKDYKIKPNDVIAFNLFSNEGFKLVDVTGSGSGVTNSSSFGFDYVVEPDGRIKLPVLGRIPIGELTIREAELMLEQKYEAYYTKPFVLLNIKNRRVIVFPGNASSGSVINLTNENTTLIEVLAMAGGIPSTGKAARVKLIRGSLQTPQVQLIDISTVKGLKEASLIIQPGDIIYVESRARISQELLGQISPVISLITSFLFIYSLILTK